MTKKQVVAGHYGPTTTFGFIYGGEWLHRRKRSEPSGGSWRSAPARFPDGLPVALIAHGQQSGRFTAESMMHSVPHALRPALCAPAGKLIVSADYSQTQPRILHLLSGDDEFGRPFLEGRDFYAQLAAELYDKDFAAVTSEERSRAKTVGVGIPNGMRARGLHRILRKGNSCFKVYEAAAIVDRYMAKYATLFSWIRKLEEDSHSIDAKGNHIYAILLRPGRVLRLRSSGKPLLEGQVVADLGQAVEAEIVVDAILGIARRLRNLKNTQFLHCIHDEILLATTEAEAEEAKRILVEEMGAAFRNRFPEATIVGDIVKASGPAKSWGVLKD